MLETGLLYRITVERISFKIASPFSVNKFISASYLIIICQSAAQSYSQYHGFTVMAMQHHLQSSTLGRSSTTVNATSSISR